MKKTSLMQEALAQAAEGYGLIVTNPTTGITICYDAKAGTWKIARSLDGTNGETRCPKLAIRFLLFGRSEDKTE